MSSHDPRGSGYRKQWDQRGSLWNGAQTRKLGNQVLADLEREFGPIDEEGELRIRAELVALARER